MEQRRGYNIRSYNHKLKQWRGPRATNSTPGIGSCAFLPAGWIDNDSTCDAPVLLVEGASDTLTLHGAGLSAIGRPNNAAGGEVVALITLRRGLLESSRPLVIVGERDKNEESGDWPALRGAIQFADAMIAAGIQADRLSVTFPPGPHKDARAWTNAVVGLVAWDDRIEANAATWRAFGDMARRELLNRTATLTQAREAWRICEQAAKEKAGAAEGKLAAADIEKIVADVWIDGAALPTTNPPSPPVVTFDPCNPPPSNCRASPDVSKVARSGYRTEKPMDRRPAMPSASRVGRGTR